MQQVCQEQLNAALKDVQYNPKSNFNLFHIGKAIKEAGSLVVTKKVLTKDSVKFVSSIIMTKNGVIFCAYLRREHKISTIWASTSVTMSIKGSHNDQTS